MLAVNTPMHCRAGAVGRLLPGIEHRLEPVAGVDRGGRLHVRGPNVMQGYLLAERPGTRVPPATDYGEGWYDTGDVVDIDEDGFITIKGRAKRFAKIGGEMISLTVVEEMAGRVWPDAQHAAVVVPDPKKGEAIVLVTDRGDADRQALAECLRAEGLSELHLPREMKIVEKMPLLATGKVDYVTVAGMVGGGRQVA